MPESKSRLATYVQSTLHASATHVVVVGIGAAVGRDVLNLVASPPSEANVVNSDDWSMLAKLVSLVGARLCPPTKPKKCDMSVDISLVVDTSGSIAPFYGEVAAFVNGLLDRLRLAPDAAQVSLTSFQSSPNDISAFVDSLAEARAAASNLPGAYGGTGINEALVKFKLEAKERKKIGY